MPDRPGERSLLEGFLDGTLTGSEREQALTRLAEDPARRATRDLQVSIDDALRRTLGPDTAAAERILAAIPPQSRRQRPMAWWRPVAAAAVLLLTLAGAWSLLSRDGSGSPSYAPRSWQAADAWYAEIDDAGAVPDWACETETIFADFFDEHFAQRLLIRPGGGEDRVLGLSRVHLVTPRTMALLSRRDDTLIVIFIDRLERDRGIDLPDDSPLDAHRFELERLVIYVVGPDDAEWAFDVFDSVDAPTPRAQLRSGRREAP